MEQQRSADVQQLLKDLREGVFGYQRKEAAEKIARLTTSDPEIVVALLVARRSDPDEAVQNAAAAALKTPVHWTVMNDNSPDILDVATEQIRQRGDWNKVRKVSPKPPVPV